MGGSSLLCCPASLGASLHTVLGLVRNTSTSARYCNSYMDCQHCSYMQAAQSFELADLPFRQFSCWRKPCTILILYQTMGNLQHADVLCPCACRNKSEQGMPLVRRRMLLGPRGGPVDEHEKFKELMLAEQLIAIVASIYVITGVLVQGPAAETKQRRQPGTASMLSSMHGLQIKKDTLQAA